MDIEEFYDGDPRRRGSPEVEFGTEWHDQAGARYELSWVRDTGELYVMREPRADVAADIFGDELIRPGPVNQETVQVVASVPTLDAVEKLLEGWAEAMAGGDSVGWLADRIKAAGLAPRQSGTTA